MLCIPGRWGGLQAPLVPDDWTQGKLYGYVALKDYELTHFSSNHKMGWKKLEHLHRYTMQKNVNGKL